MVLARALLVLSMLVFSDPVSLFAQRGRLDCPRPVRERRYTVMPKPYLELSAGLTTPFLYRNGAGPLAENYSFNSRPTPYATGIAYFRLKGDMDAFAGIGIMQLWQGLAFQVADRNASLDVNSYAGSLVTSLPFGIRFRIGDRWTINTGAYLAYASHSGQRESPNSSGGGNPSFYRYDAPDDRSLNYGLRLSADVWVIRRFGLNLVVAADGRRSAPGRAIIQATNQQLPVEQAALEPYLLHAGVGISYRLFHHADD